MCGEAGNLFHVTRPWIKLQTAAAVSTHDLGMMSVTVNL